MELNGFKTLGFRAYISDCSLLRVASGDSEVGSDYTSNGDDSANEERELEVRA